MGSNSTFQTRDGAKITWLGHDGFKIEDNGVVLVIDPFQLIREVRADYLLISHEHFDHFNPDDLKKVVGSGTTVVAIPACKEELSKVKSREVKYVKPGDKLKLGDYEVSAIPAYNIDKFAEPGRVFHPKADGKVGYVVRTRGGTTIYHTGDSDLIPEMEDLRPDIALLPVSGTYVMTADEAIRAAGKIKPKIAIPMHFGSIVGSVQDAEKFKQGVSCEVHILQKE